MIKVNNAELVWQQGTIVHLIDQIAVLPFFEFMKSTDYEIIVNGEIIEKEAYNRFVIYDGSTVRVIPRIFGG